MDGRQLAERIRDHNPSARLLYITGHGEDARRSHGLPASAVILQKPFGPAELARKVREVLDAPCPAPAELAHDEVLVVVDDAEARALIVEALQKSGLSVRAAGTAAAADTYRRHRHTIAAVLIEQSELLADLQNINPALRYRVLNHPITVTHLARELQEACTS